MWDSDTVTKDYVIEDDSMGNMTLLVAGAELPISKDYMKIVRKNGRKKIVRIGLAARFMPRRPVRFTWPRKP